MSSLLLDDPNSKNKNMAANFALSTVTKKKIIGTAIKYHLLINECRMHLIFFHPTSLDELWSGFDELLQN